MTPPSPSPPPTLAVPAPRTSRHGTILAVSMMKDEAPYLLEWVAHHLAVGFTDLLVYTNDCTDGTVEMLERLETLGLAHHRPNEIPPGQKPQPSALNHAQEEPLVAAADWVMVFDADEFLSVNHPAGHLDGMLDDVVAQGANGIVVTWRIFGSNGVVDWSRAPVTEQYTRAAPPLWNKGWGVKTLFRFDPEFWKLGIHRPAIRSRHLETGFPDTVRWLNGSGQPMEDYFKFRGWRSIRRTLGYDWAQMNHYAVKSIDSYAIRKLRGNVNNKADKYNADYWALQDRNEVADTRILRHAPARDAILTALRADPVLGALHAAAVARVEARLTEMRGTAAYSALRDSLIAASAIPITEVEAKPPQARDPARIAALMSRVERKATHEGRAAARATGAPISGWGATGAALYQPGRLPPVAPDVPWVANHGIDLPADPAIFTAEAVMAILAGKFDRRHARNAALHLDGVRRLLDLGAGIALPALVAARAHPGLTAMIHDARPGMMALSEAIQTRAACRDPARLRLIDGPLTLPHDAPDRATGLAACLAEFRPDALRLSAAADLTPDQLAAADLSRLTRLLLPVDSPAESDTLRAALTPALSAAGFTEAPDSAATGTLRFDRTPA